MGCWKWENNCLDTHLVLEKGMDLLGHFLTTFEFRLWRICTFYEFLALCESTMYTRNAFRNINMTSCCNNKVCKRMIFLYIKNDMIDLSKYYVFLSSNLNLKGENYQKGWIVLVWHPPFFVHSAIWATNLAAYLLYHSATQLN